MNSLNRVDRNGVTAVHAAAPNVCEEHERKDATLKVRDLGDESIRRSPRRSRKSVIRGGGKVAGVNGDAIPIAGIGRSRDVSVAAIVDRDRNAAVVLSAAQISREPGSGAHLIRIEIDHKRISVMARRSATRSLSLAGLV